MTKRVRLLVGTKKGAFVATDNPDDCKYCDHAPICRVQTGEFHTSSPRAEWAKEFGASDPAYAGMRLRRATSDE